MRRKEGLKDRETGKNITAIAGEKKRGGNAKERDENALKMVDMKAKKKTPHKLLSTGLQKLKRKSGGGSLQFSRGEKEDKRKMGE